MLGAGAVSMLVGMLPSQPAAADLLCFMATQPQCKEAFLDSTALGTLVHLLQAGAASGATSCSLLYRFQTIVQRSISVDELHGWL